MRNSKEIHERVGGLLRPFFRDPVASVLQYDDRHVRRHQFQLLPQHPIRKTILLEFIAHTRHSRAIRQRRSATRALPLRRKPGLPDGYAEAVVAAPLKNASKSALTMSAWVAGIPWGRPE